MTRSGRRDVLRTIGASLASSAFARQAEKQLFQPTWRSLKQYRCPDWFRDAKFGIWAHWGPQGAPKQGDWYARNMYIQGTRQYEHHLKTYGHPSQFGYKDVIQLWKGENWEPEALMRRYRKTGARYFAALGVHCDNFDIWNSKHHRWNSVNFGPKRDIVGTWCETARKHGMRFMVSEHLAWSWSWFNVNKNSDPRGPYAGVPYDGVDPKNQDLYWPPHPETSANYPKQPSEQFKWSWFTRVKDLIDSCRPDMVYTDGGVFGQVGLNMMAHFYNASMAWHGGRQEGVYTIKDHTRRSLDFGDYQEGAATLDMERSLMTDIQAQPFQTDTCLGHWQYFEGFEYKQPLDVIHMLVDVVSKNGNLLLSVPQLPDGTIDSKEESILDDIAAWMAINGEAIFDTRPWKKFGEGPTWVPTGEKTEDKRKPFTSSDLRFTTKRDKLYVICLGWPEGDLAVRSLGTAAHLWEKRIEQIRMLGGGPVKWTHGAEQLLVHRPSRKPSEYAVVFEVS